MASAVWLGLALVASIISIRIAMSVALIEIMVGVIAGNTIGLHVTEWVNFLACFGAILLTFLAGTEIDAKVVRKHFWSSMSIGVVAFLAPYVGVLVYAHYLIGRGHRRRSRGFHFAGSEAVLPAYLVGMALAPAFLSDPELPHRMRIIAFTILTPFYFLKAGSLVDFHAMLATLGLIVVFLVIKMATKFIGILPLTRTFRFEAREGMYTTLLMSTGLTFGRSRPCSA